MLTVWLLLLALMVASVCAESDATNPEIPADIKPENANESEATEQEPKKPKMRRVKVPQYEGEKFVQNVTVEDFDSVVQSAPTVVLIAAKWCPHCRNYLPEFNRIAFEYTEGAELAGAGWKFARYFTQESESSQRDPLMKKFDLDAVPRLLIFKDNRYWVYESTDKLFDKVTAWISKQDYEKAKLYPSYIPDFYDNIRSFFREIMRGVDITIQENPEKFGQFKVFAGIVGGVFGLFFLLALLSGGSESHESQAKKKDD